ncbi:MAG: DUF6884 domain-containing protein [Candidatus Nanohaloarchaea archaeon]
MIEADTFSMVLHVTYCSKKKSREPGKLPAIERYNSERIEELHEQARQNKEDFAILSGEHGLVTPTEEVTYYDRLLREEDLEEMIPVVREDLQGREVSKVVYHTREIESERVPYFRLIRESCRREKIDFSYLII